MRLGAQPCRLVPGTKAAKCYGREEISERHRHRYEVNNAYRQRFEQAGVVFSGLSPDGNLVEILELRDHPFFLAVQKHLHMSNQPGRIIIDSQSPIFNLFPGIDQTL